MAKITTKAPAYFSNHFLFLTNVEDRVRADQIVYVFAVPMTAFAHLLKRKRLSPTFIPGRFLLFEKLTPDSASSFNKSLDLLRKVQKLDRKQAVGFALHLCYRKQAVAQNGYGENRSVKNLTVEIMTGSQITTQQLDVDFGAAPHLPLAELVEEERSLDEQLGKKGFYLVYPPARLDQASQKNLILYLQSPEKSASLSSLQEAIEDIQNRFSNIERFIKKFDDLYDQGKIVLSHNESPQYSIKKCGRGWEVCYEGKKLIFRDSKGIRILEKVLHNPNKDLFWNEIDAINRDTDPVSTGSKKQIEAAFDRHDQDDLEQVYEKKIKGIASHIDDIGDKKLLEDSFRKLREAKRALEIAEELGNDIEKHRKEVDFWNSEINELTNKWQKKVRFKTDEDRAVESMQKNLRDFKRQVRRTKDADDFYAHIDQQVSIGRICKYSPDRNITWT